MRNYDLSPLLRQWIGFDKLASSMGARSLRDSRPTILRKATTTIIAFPWRWPVSGRVSWISKWKARA